MVINMWVTSCELQKPKKNDQYLFKNILDTLVRRGQWDGLGMELDLTQVTLDES